MLKRLPLPRRRPKADAQPEHEPPHPLLLLLEGRAPWEFAALMAASPWLKHWPRGDGHPVMVFPGLGANDLSTAPLRRWLDSLGYQTHPWAQGFNFGPRPGVLEQAEADLERIFQADGRKLSLLGWSLGGIYARELAKRHPQWVRNVITLGTPFTGHPRATHAWKFFEFVSGHDSHDEATLAGLRQAPPVPTTSIYSRSDGVVSWRCSVNEPAPQVENIEVHASHLGLGLNPLALYAVADRLAQPPMNWRPFDPRGAKRWFYPR
ncbi:pimeloyl-ACP methyl ester carboxylesterase [Inhella inkyongensis]|uniref:Pimeloyl-ACP methyl ester carboxylesterase n=1 Tax=Inhella inkyongensis TaxID=392593 RepID=A0A840S910_9BURK|nr:alpha/beta hydrolase [Inhella inkyongensis]MBB5205274.1 pimeloyl-ACP methyl ester carboxylesterase [Inhella inkyongensis]